MGYSINILNSDNGKEELVRGENINEVLHIVSNNIVNIKKNVSYTIGNQKINYEISGSELKKLIINTKKELAKRTSEELKYRINERNLILVSSLNQKIDVWNKLIQENSQPFNTPPPNKKDIPNPPKYLTIDEKPFKESSKYLVKKNILDYILKTKYQLKVSEKENLYKTDLTVWEDKRKEIDKINLESKTNYNNLVKQTQIENENNYKNWLSEKDAFVKNQNDKIKFIQNMEEDFKRGSKEAIEYYFEKLLCFSKDKNDFYDKEVMVAYNVTNKILVIEFSLPNLEDIPSLKETRYVISKDEFEEKSMSKTEYSKYYDDVIYQITLRSLHETFCHDEYNFISAVGFNGFVKTIDKATGKYIKPFILSILVNKNDFAKINLEKIEFKSCFKSLKGISASTLSNLTPISPILNIDRHDKRFIEKKDIARNLDDKINLASMNWEDFEHLVREIFEKEFSVNGGEVKVTQASRDGGVDAIAFDPDPIRGGKIVIQAKRYTNTVGVNAVRDLYGTILNEGATKGILVTTSYYGPDAYEFAKGKPITLLNGNNLLYLLEKHGHKAKIDLIEAKINLNKT